MTAKGVVKSLNYYKISLGWICFILTLILLAVVFEW